MNLRTAAAPAHAWVPVRLCTAIALHTVLVTAALAICAVTAVQLRARPVPGIATSAASRRPLTRE